MPKMFIHPAPLTPGVRRTRIQAHFVRKRAMLRCARTSYDSVGRYVTASRLPFSTAAGAWNEQQATQVTTRDEFGNATGQSAINGTTQTARFGVLGRPYFTKDNIGHASTTTFRLCGTGTNQVSCGTDTRLKFRAQTITAGSNVARMKRSE